MKRMLLMVLAIIVACAVSSLAARADFATPFVEINNKVGDSATAILGITGTASPDTTKVVEAVQRIKRDILVFFKKKNDTITAAC